MFHFTTMPRRGATLVEALIYLFILGLLSLVVVNLLLIMVRSFYSFRSGRELTHSATVSLERLIREIRQAQSVDLLNSDLGRHPGRLVLQTTDGGGNPTTITFSLINNTLMIKEGSEPAASSTSAAVRVDNLEFRSLATPVSQMVKVDLTLRAGAGVAARTEKFYGSAILRSSY